MRFFPLASVRAAAARAAVARAAVAVAATVALAGCSFFTGIPTVDRVEVSVSPRTITVNQQAFAVGTAYNGSSVIRNAKRQVTFKSSNPAVATVNPSTGLVIGVTVGVTEISGEAGGKRDVDTVTVRLVQARSVLITPREPVYRVGATNGIGAFVRDSNGAQITDRAVVWKSSNEAVLSVSAGVVTPRAAGTAQIIATIDNGANGIGARADTVTATVTPTPVVRVGVTPEVVTVQTGQTTRFSATVVDSLQQTVTGRRVVWRASPASAVTIDSTTGSVTATSQVDATVTIAAVAERIPGAAIREEVAGTATLRVRAPTARVIVSANGFPISSISLRTGTSAGVLLNAVDVFGNLLADRSFRVTSSNPAVVAVPDAAQTSAFAINAGSTTGTATLTIQGLDLNGNAQGTSATLTVTVTP